MRKLFKRMINFFDKQQEAITFAQAGEHEYAKSIIDDYIEINKTKLLVVGRKAAFSKNIMDYALDMAERMSYEILALSAAPLSCETFQLLSHRKLACEEFKTLATENAKTFEAAANEKGIPFTHIIKFNEPEKALLALCRENDDVAFVVAENVDNRSEDRIEQGERLHNKLFVYSMV